MTPSALTWIAMTGGLAGGLVLGWLAGLEVCRRERQALWSVSRDLQEDLAAMTQVNTYLTNILSNPNDPMNQRRRDAWLARVRPKADQEKDAS